MEIRTKVSQGILHVYLNGEFDVQTAQLFKEVVDRIWQEEQTDFVFLYMQEITFLDSSGLGAILGRYRNLFQHNAELVIVGPRPGIHSIMSMAGLQSIISIFPSIEESLEHVRGVRYAK